MSPLLRNSIRGAIVATAGLLAFSALRGTVAFWALFGGAILIVLWWEAR